MPQGQAGSSPDRLLEEIEFEIRQWYAGDYDARVCAERILALLKSNDRIEEVGQPLDDRP